MRILANGNVGIANDTPACKLHVAGDGQVQMKVEAQHLYDPIIQLTDNGSSNTADWLMLMDNSVDDELQFRADGNIKLKLSKAGNMVLGSSNNVESAYGLEIANNGRNIVLSFFNGQHYWDSIFPRVVSTPEILLF